MNDLIRREEAHDMFEEECCGECDICNYNEVGNCSLIDTIPAADIFSNISLCANHVFETLSDETFTFRETDEMCPNCQHDLEVAYFENRTYAVRCKHCKVVSLVRATCPREAAEEVALKSNIKPVRRGQWIRRSHRIFGNTYDYECSVCGCDYALAEYSYCPDCGARMDGDLNG